VDLEEGVLVEQALDVAAHVEGLPLAVGHQRAEVDLGRRGPRLGTRRRPLPARRQVGQVPAHDVERLLLALAQEVAHAALGAVHARTAHGLERRLLPVTISTIRSEPRYIDALPSTMATTSQKAGMYAPPARWARRARTPAGSSRWPHLVPEDLARPTAPREEVDLVGDPSPAESTR
jgi:hypothetical protein